LTDRESWNESGPLKTWEVFLSFWRDELRIGAVEGAEAPLALELCRHCH
jgi:hypothetical protein